MFEIPTSTICRNGYDYDELVTEVQDHLIESEIFVPRWRREPLEVETFAFRHMQELMAIEKVEEDRYVTYVLKRWDPATETYTPFEENPERWLRR